MPLKRQWFKPGRSVELVANLAAQPLFSRRRKGAARPGTAESSVLTRLAQDVGALFSILLSVVLIVVIAALVFAFIKEVRRETIYLEPVDVPEDLVKRGYSPGVVTDRLLDRVRAIQTVATTPKARLGVESNAAQVDIQVPGGAASMKGLVRYARNMLDLPEQHLGGEITRDGDSLRLLLRLRDRHKVTVIADAIAADSVDGLLQKGGEAIVRATDPYVLASYWYQNEDPKRNFENTLAEIDYVLSHPPASDDAWALSLWGNVLRAQGDLPGAMAKYRQSIALDPQGSYAYGALLSILIESGRTDEANAVLQRVAYHPHPTSAVLLGMGDAYASLGKIDKALESYERAAKADPTNPAPVVSLGITYYQLRRYDDAERAAEEAIARRPIPLAYLISLGVALDRGRVEDARKRAEQIDAISPSLSAGAVANGWVRNMEHRYAEAISLFERGVTGQGALDPYAWWGYGRALAGEGSHELALEKYRRALALGPMVEALTDQGVALAALGQDEAALASFAEAEKVGPRYARLYAQWARVLDKANRRDEAAAKRAKAEALAREQHVPLDE